MRDSAGLAPAFPVVGRPGVVTDNPDGTRTNAPSLAVRLPSTACRFKPPGSRQALAHSLAFKKDA